MLHGYVVDKLLNEHRLADARAAEQSYLTALGVWLQQVNDLDTGFQYLRHRLLLLESRCLAVYLPALAVGKFAFAVDGVAQYVEHTSQSAVAHRHANRLSGGGYFHSSCAQQYAADSVLAGVLCDFHHALLSSYVYCQRFLYLRQFARGEHAIYYRS